MDKVLRQRQKAIDFALGLMKEKRREWSVSAHGAKDGFEFGFRAQKHVEEIDAYMQILEQMKNEGPLL